MALRKKKKTSKKKSAKKKRKTARKTKPKLCGANTAHGKCELVAGWGTGKKAGRCRYHAEKGSARLQDRKRIFLEEYGKGTISIAGAARLVDGWEMRPLEDGSLERVPMGGVDPATVWRWAQDDPEFKAAYAKARERADELRPIMVEDTLFSRIIAGKETGAVAIRWLERRSRDRWRPPHLEVRVNLKDELAKLLGVKPEDLPDSLDAEAA